jgi:hypothetical protein
MRNASCASLLGKPPFLIVGWFEPLRDPTLGRVRYSCRFAHSGSSGTTSEPHSGSYAPRSTHCKKLDFASAYQKRDRLRVSKQWTAIFRDEREEERAAALPCPAITHVTFQLLGLASARPNLQLLNFGSISRRSPSWAKKVVGGRVKKLPRRTDRRSKTKHYGVYPS